MSTTLDSFDGGVSSDTCPHGEPTDDELSCYLCYNESETGRMALTDPRRDSDE